MKIYYQAVNFNFFLSSLEIFYTCHSTLKWDTAGQERYRQSIVAHYYRNVNAVVFVYDVFEPKSFKSLPAWIAECRKHALTASEDTPHILIGNKCDLQQMKGGTTLPAVERERVKMDQAQVITIIIKT